MHQTSILFQKLWPWDGCGCGWYLTRYWLEPCNTLSKWVLGSLFDYLQTLNWSKLISSLLFQLIWSMFSLCMELWYLLCQMLKCKKNQIMLMTYFFGNPIWYKLQGAQLSCWNPLQNLCAFWHRSQEGFPLPHHAKWRTKWLAEPQCWAWMFSSLIFVTIKIWVFNVYFLQGYFSETPPFL